MVKPIIQSQGCRLPVARGRARMRLPLVGLLVLACTAVQAQDEFMMQLENELGGLVADEPGGTSGAAPTEAGRPTTRPATSQQQEAFLDDLDSEIDGMTGTPGRASSAVPEDPRAQFDADLRDRMPGTFVLYTRLSDDKKALVFDEYQVSGDYLRVRRRIMDLRRMR